jgi:hypothetical protein
MSQAWLHCCFLESLPAEQRVLVHGAAARRYNKPGKATKKLNPTKQRGFVSCN